MHVVGVLLVVAHQTLLAASCAQPGGVHGLDPAGLIGRGDGSITQARRKEMLMTAVLRPDVRPGQNLRSLRYLIPRPSSRDSRPWANWRSEVMSASQSGPAWSCSASHRARPASMAAKPTT